MVPHSVPTCLPGPPQLFGTVKKQLQVLPVFQLPPPNPAPGHPSPGTAREEAALARMHGGLEGRGVREDEDRVV